mmetsp:Transcript_7317/g.26159  ORF Transcript_7317/g.26159 Transcript_7317/m.26159 type:complete len:325 (+) Transcript_7317:1110-2084(+)
MRGMMRRSFQRHLVAARVAAAARALERHAVGLQRRHVGHELAQKERELLKLFVVRAHVLNAGRERRVVVARPVVQPCDGELDRRRLVDVGLVGAEGRDDDVLSRAVPLRKVQHCLGMNGGRAEDEDEALAEADDARRAAVDVLAGQGRERADHGDGQAVKVRSELLHRADRLVVLQHAGDHRLHARRLDAQLVAVLRHAVWRKVGVGLAQKVQLRQRLRLVQDDQAQSGDVLWAGHVGHVQDAHCLDRRQDALPQLVVGPAPLRLEGSRLLAHSITPLQQRKRARDLHLDRRRDVSGARDVGEHRPSAGGSRRRKRRRKKMSWR